MTISVERMSQSLSLSQRYDATWQDYVAVRDNTAIDWRKLAFHQGWLWVDMGKEGPGHASFSDFMTMLFAVWAFVHPDVPIQSYGRSLLEKPETQACAPDLVLYKGDRIPRLKPGEPRRFDLTRHRLPDLVGEVADTTLGIDLDEQKQLYASLGIPEYWVIDVKGKRLFIFSLTAIGKYEAIDTSQVLPGLSIELIEAALERLTTETNTAVANELMQQLQAGTVSVSE